MTEKLIPNNEIESNNETNYTLRDYFDIILKNIYFISIVIFLTGLIGFLFAFYKPDMYSSSSTMKLTPPKGNILDANFISDIAGGSQQNDRFIANEIEIMKSNTILYNVVASIKESFNKAPKDSFYLLLQSNLRYTDRFDFKNKNSKKKFNILNEISAPQDTLLTDEELKELLTKRVKLEQKRGLDIVEISVESPSSYEAALIVNNYTQAYINLNVYLNRTKINKTRTFLEKQRTEKMTDLQRAEDALKKFQEERKIIDVTEQSKEIIAKMSDFDAKTNSKQIDIAISQSVIDEMTKELKKLEPNIADALQSNKIESYLSEIEKSLAQLEVNKYLSLTNAKNEEMKQKIEVKFEKDSKELKNQETEKLNILKNLVKTKNAATNINKLADTLMVEQLKLEVNKISLAKLSELRKNYEVEFNKLPTNIIEFAQLQRQADGFEKLYQMVEEKYQEALVNEQSTIGDVLLIDKAQKSILPIGPNRSLITLVGLIVGLVLSLFFVFIKSYLTNTIQTPEDLQHMNIPVLGWIPFWLRQKTDNEVNSALITVKDSFSKSSELFRAIRTRIHFARTKENRIKTLLVSSSSPGEGKSTIAINLAAIFAQGDKRTLLVDCDLRKPTTHKVFGIDKEPGLVDYLTEAVTLEKIIKQTFVKNLDIITSGSSSQNPAEILDSFEMEKFIEVVRSKYDMIIIDSPPLLAVTDSEILTQLVDGCILIASYNETNREMLSKSAKFFSSSKNKFLGVVLNKFRYNIGYGYYYRNYYRNYYYYYSDKKSATFIEKLLRKRNKNNNKF